MKIDGVAISCYRLDVHLTRLCVASIRYWYPDIPVWLLKDRHYGDFDTQEIEKYWKVQIYPGRQKTLGWGFGKLEIMTELPARRLLLLDSDVVFAGRVIERLEKFDEDLVVDQEDFAPAAIEIQFFALEKLCELDPTFVFPGFGFNTGQIVATTGRLSRQDFDGLMDWDTRTVRRVDVFKKGEQGLFNYVVLRKLQLGELSVRREPFMVWPGEAARARHIRLEDLTPDGRQQQVIHWAGLGWGSAPEDMPRPEILSYFEGIYYSRIPSGSRIRRWRRAQFEIQHKCIRPVGMAARKVLSKLTWGVGSC